MRKLWVLCFVFAGFGGNPAWAISTYKNWNGAYLVSFGCPSSSTFGQVITMPKSKSHLDRFIFSWINLNGGSMVVRGEIYAWDGQKASGISLYESSPRRISFRDHRYHKVSFSPAGLALTPGAQYVLFASIDKDFEQCRSRYALGWGYISSDAYPRGSFVYQNNKGHELRWTKKSWVIYGDIDLAFKANLGF